MKFIDHLSKEQIKMFNQMRRAAKITKVIEDKHKEVKTKRNKMTRREVEDLMGTRRDTYKRVRGAVKRR